MLTLSASFTGTPRQANAASAALADGPCYGLETSPTEVDRFYCRWSLQPVEFFDAVRGDAPPVTSPQPRWEIIVTIITAMFLHGGWLHIGGNMLFLWVFGDNIEDRLGHIPYLLFYLAAGIAASLVQGVLDATSVVPVLGASGAVAGVLGAYIVWFPKATVSVVIPFFVLIFIPIPVPAVVMIGIWFLQNLLAGVATLGAAAAPGQGVAWFAHIGGFLFGMLLALPLRRRVNRRAPRWR
ncbi:MAG: rhomboid family intramembrane serine protease [Dehalococcoidia bacterium]|nr:rhomboid family intramembrane serine protease [Dehalococcoidia bacterium]